jgi:predicted patatin/cPLA2 family phospholipase
MARPVLSAHASDSHHQSLVLAGGGMRVAYQAGVLAALDQAGLRFHHVDGTSGGTMNLSMLLTGQPIDEICDRWRALDPRGFAYPLPVGEYVRSPHWLGLGGDRGIRTKVFPALGIDADAVRKADGLTGTYNVANFATKTAEVFHHSDVDEDLLVAAISLPVLMPAVHRHGVAYTDAVWIRDSNVPEAVRQGSRDVWLIWCIGNSPQYRRGSFRQYVHMIEMAAAGSLLADLRCLAGLPSADELRLHVIKPARPMPLDPSYFLGHIDGATLIGMGYRDACAYLRTPKPFSLPCGNEVTAMSTVEPAVFTTLGLGGSFAWQEPTGGKSAGPLHVGLHLHGAQSEWSGGGSLDAVGEVTIPKWPARHPVEQGWVRFDPAGRVELELTLWEAGGRYRLRGQSGSDRMTFTLLSDDQSGASTLGTGFAPFARAEAVRLIRGLHSSDSATILLGWQAKSSAAGILWRAVGGPP